MAVTPATGGGATRAGEARPIGTPTGSTPTSEAPASATPRGATPLGMPTIGPGQPAQQVVERPVLHHQQDDVVERGVDAGGRQLGGAG